jgi:hypothetical protein
MARSKKTISANLAEMARYQELTGKINVKVMKRVHKIRQVVQRRSWRSDSINPLIQAKLSQLTL